MSSPKVPTTLVLGEVSIPARLTAYVHSTYAPRSEIALQPGKYIVKDWWEQLNGEVLVQVSNEGGDLPPLIAGTHWGPTPLGKALQP